MEASLPRFSRIHSALKRRATQIELLLMDVDGTMTDGSVTLLSQTDGSALEIKTFDAHDGQGLTLAHTAGIRTGVITGRGSAALRRRCWHIHRRSPDRYHGVDMGPDGEAANRAPMHAEPPRQPEYACALAVFAVVCSELTVSKGSYSVETLAR